MRGGGSNDAERGSRAAGRSQEAGADRVRRIIYGVKDINSWTNLDCLGFPLPLFVCVCLCAYVCVCMSVAVYVWVGLCTRTGVSAVVYVLSV